MENHYKILEMPKTAADEIKSAYLPTGCQVCKFDLGGDK
jgi:hypothetical protein